MLLLLLLLRLRNFLAIALLHDAEAMVEADKIKFSSGEFLVGGQNLRKILVRAGGKREKDNKDKCGPLGITRSRGIIFSRKIPDKIGGNT